LTGMSLLDVIIVVYFNTKLEENSIRLKNISISRVEKLRIIIG